MFSGSVYPPQRPHLPYNFVAAEENRDFNPICPVAMVINLEEGLRARRLSSFPMVLSSLAGEARAAERGQYGEGCEFKVFQLSSLRLAAHTVRPVRGLGLLLLLRLWFELLLVPLVMRLLLLLLLLRLLLMCGLGESALLLEWESCLQNELGGLVTVEETSALEKLLLLLLPLLTALCHYCSLVLAISLTLGGLRRLQGECLSLSSLLLATKGVVRSDDLPHKH